MSHWQEIGTLDSGSKPATPLLIGKYSFKLLFRQSKFPRQRAVLFVQTYVKFGITAQAHTFFFWHIFRSGFSVLEVHAVFIFCIFLGTFRNPLFTPAPTSGPIFGSFRWTSPSRCAPIVTTHLILFELACTGRRGYLFLQAGTKRVLRLRIKWL